MSAKANSFLRPLIMITLGTLFYVYGFTLRIMPSAMTHELMHGFQINAALLGILVGLMYYGYTLMQIPGGLLYDRFPSRIILTVSMLVCSTGTLIFALTTHIWLACIGTFIMGLGEAFAFVGVLVLAARWYPAKYFALIVGIVQLMGALGAILGEGPIALTVNHLGWHNTILMLSVLGYILAILIWLLVRDAPHTPTHSISKNQSSYSELQRLKIVCGNRQTWWLALYSFCIWGPILILAGLWLVPYLMALYHTSNTVAATASSWVWLGIGIGSPIFGWWSDRITRRCFPLAVSALLALVPAFFIIYVHLSWPMMYFLLFVFGVGGSGQALSFGLVQDNNPPHVAGTAVGLNNMAVVFGGVILQPLAGYLLHLQWSGSIVNGAPVYSASNYRAALIMVPLCALVALIVSLFFLKETHCKPQYDLDVNSQDLKLQVDSN